VKAGSRPGALAACDKTKTRKEDLMSYISGGRVLVRSRDDRLVAGVCSGLARYLGLDVSLARGLFVLVAIFTGGTAVVAYLIGWAVIPEEGRRGSIAEELVNKNRMN
jgi:phage shock protein PspC (stress-responsive transcriptional regulator)